MLDGIAAAREAGLAPIKLNCVVQRGVNEDGLLDLVDFARREGLQPALHRVHGRGRDQRMAHGRRGQRRGDPRAGATGVPAARGGRPIRRAVARTYRFADGAGDLGVITSVSRPFCGDCTRARLGVDGKLYTCLFATAGIDLREPLRSGADDDALRRIIADRWKRRDDRYSELRGLGVAEGERIEMSYIGG